MPWLVLRNYDHSGDNWKIQDGKIIDDGNLTLRGENGEPILSEDGLNRLLSSPGGRNVLEQILQSYGASGNMLGLVQEGNIRMRIPALSARPCRRHMKMEN